MSFEDIQSGRRPFTRIINSPSPEDRPSQSIVAAVFQINTAVASFQRLVNSLGTPKDTLDLRLKLHKTRLQIGQLVKETSAKLKQASETDQHSHISPAKKIADAKLAKDFQSVLREFQKAQRLAAERETAYAPSVQKEVLPSRNTASELEMRSSKKPEQVSLLVESTSQEALVLENEIMFNEAIIEEREQGIQEIHEQIGEVNEIFKDLAVLVHEQGALIDDISSNVQNSHVSTVQATSQLTKASKYQKSMSSMFEGRFFLDQAIIQFQGRFLDRIHHPVQRQPCWSLQAARIPDCLELMPSCIPPDMPIPPYIFMYKVVIYVPIL